MDTSKMKPIVAIPVERMEEYRDSLTKIRRELDTVYAEVETQVLYTQIRRLFDENYDLGRVDEVFEVFGGYTNRSFGVRTVKDGVGTDYFVRKYKSEISDADVLMEHGLIRHAIGNGFPEAAGIFPARDGRSFVRQDELKAGRTVSRVWAVYRFLPGADKYTWIDNESTPAEYRNLGDLLARFHGAAHRFAPDESQRKTEPKVAVLIPDFKRMFSERASQPVDTLFHAYFVSVLPQILRQLDEWAITPEEYASLPQCPVHGDFHAGNVKFDGESAVGLYDFDWSKVDVRLFDVCLGLVYCCGSWRMETEGQLRLDDCRQFLEGYNSALAGGAFPPFTDDEKRVFVRMLAGAHFYLVYWLTELWYYLDVEGINNYEAISYMDHFIRGLNWLRGHAQELQDLV
jgi:homoserine kinase type II